MKWAYTLGATLIGLALLLLLGYSLDRTSWLLSLYEAETPGTLAAWLHVSPLALGVAAAAVIEAGAVALIIADALGKLDERIALYVWVGLIVVLAVQGFANLLAGFLRGFQQPIAALTAQGVKSDTAQTVAVAAWLVANVAIPLLIFVLAKLEARVLALWFSLPTAQPRRDVRALLRELLHRPVAAPQLPAQEVYARPQAARIVSAPVKSTPIADESAGMATDSDMDSGAIVADSGAIVERQSTTARVRAYATARGIAVSTAWKHYRKNPAVLDSEGV